MSEVGSQGFNKFRTAKLFSSWLRIAPNIRISGGKVLSNREPKGNNRLKISLRLAANAIGNLKDTHLSDFFVGSHIEKEGILPSVRRHENLQ
jgi:hypothetical protein